MEPFKHNLTPDNLAGIFAYGSCLQSILTYLIQETQFKPEKRMIDSVPLLEKVKASADEMIRLLSEARKNLETKK